MSQSPDPNPPPPRAFTQGVGTVFQFVGVGLFLASMFICCGSSLLSKDTAVQAGLTEIGWHISSDPTGHPIYSIQRATTLTVLAGVLFGMAMAGLGLGLQAQRPHCAAWAVTATAFAAAFWAIHALFF